MAPLAAGLQAVYTSATPAPPAYWRHSDWLGSSRLASTASQMVYYDAAYAPFGETYAETGTADRSFTGQTQDVIAGSTGIYDFLFRQHSAAQGRWLVPDPAGLAAADLSNPQTWNRYAYVGNNPLSNVDPLGLDDDHECGGMPCGWPGPGQQLPEGDGPDPCGYICMSPPFPVPIPVGGGGGGGGGTGMPSTPPSSPPSSGPSKPINFPTETNGIPKGLNVNFGGPRGAILPSAICGDMGPCVAVGLGFQAQPQLPSQSSWWQNFTNWLQAASSEWPLNGNVWPGFAPQDGVCSTGPFASKMNGNPAILKCCQAHDSCYETYHCNASSWLPSGVSGACTSCNAMVSACIVTAK